VCPDEGPYVGGQPAKKINGPICQLRTLIDSSTIEPSHGMCAPGGCLRVEVIPTYFPNTDNVLLPGDVLQKKSDVLVGVWQTLLNQSTIVGEIDGYIVVRFAPPLTNPSSSSSSASYSSSSEFCRCMKSIHGVTPGKSWGTLKTREQKEWVDRACDDFFCEPNKLKGRGSYDCIPKQIIADKQYPEKLVC